MQQPVSIISTIFLKSMRFVTITACTMRCTSINCFCLLIVSSNRICSLEPLIRIMNKEIFCGKQVSINDQIHSMKLCFICSLFQVIEGKRNQICWVKKRSVLPVHFAFYFDCSAIPNDKNHRTTLNEKFSGQFKDEENFFFIKPLSI